MISITHFKLEKLIGKGSFGKVYTANLIKSNKIYAIKKINILNINQYEKNV